MSTVIVTGGAGFIGSHLVDLLVARGDRVAVIDNLASGKRERIPEGVAFFELDVADADAVKAAAVEFGPVDTWFHMAAQADVRVSVEQPLVDARTNVLGTISVLEAARSDEARVVFASTGGAIYGDAELPTPESAAERPESPYGAAKLAAEKYVEMYARLYGARHAIVRYSNVYGPRQDPHGEAGVVAIFCGCILGDRAATIYGDGTQTRDYVYVADVAAVTAAMADSEAPAGVVPVYNVGTGDETTVLTLWQTLQEAAGVELGSNFAPPRLGELARSALDASLARERLGIAIDTPLLDGLAATLDAARNGQ